MKTDRFISALMGIAIICLVAPGKSQDLAGVGDKIDSLAPATGGQVWVQVFPWSRTPGKEDVATVEAVLPRGAQNIVFFAAHGKITNVEMLSPTNAKARYHAPASYLPQVDIVAAMVTVEDNRVWGFATVLLMGQGEGEITTRPGAEAFITIGDRVFGPEVADSNGNAKIPIEVPPGAQFGQDEQGDAVDLGVPPTARTAVFAEMEKVPADKVDEVDLFGVVVARDGFLDETSPLVMIADKGSVQDLERVGGGSFTARYIPPTSYRGPVKIEAFVPGDEAPPAELAIELSDSFSMANFDMRWKSGKKKKDEGDLDYDVYATVKLGFAWDLPAMSALFIGADAGASLKLLSETFSAGLDFGFMLSSKTATVLINDISDNELKLDAEFTTLIFPIAANLGWYRPLSARLGLWILGEGGFILLNNRVNTISDSRGVDGVMTNDVKIAQRRLESMGLVGVGTAVELEVGPGCVVTGFKWRWYPGAIQSIHGVFSSLNVEIGYRFWFF